MREFSRIDAHLPMRARLVRRETLEGVESRVLMQIEFAKSTTLPAVDNKELNDWLVLINAKLDAIVNMLNFEREGFLSLPFTRVNISGGGMSFKTAESCNPGDLFEIKMLLPLSPPPSPLPIRRGGQGCLGERGDCSRSPFYCNGGGN